MKKINVREFIVSFCISTGIFALLVLVAAFIGMGTRWEFWKNEGQLFLLIVTLFVYRTLEYTLPAVAIKKLRQRTWITAFNSQFASYAFLKALVFIFGLDYALDVELFASAEAFIIVIGYVITYLSGKQQEIKNIADITEDSNDPTSEREN